MLLFLASRALKMNLKHQYPLLNMFITNCCLSTYEIYEMLLLIIRLLLFRVKASNICFILIKCPT